MIVESHSFDAVSQWDAEYLILGSLPGIRSLAARQYYAQPHNAFWRIMGELFDAGPTLPYAARLERLIASKIALWDVVASGMRPGSLDSSIDKSSVVVNDLTGFLGQHRSIARIAFNGRTASELFRNKVAPQLTARQRAIPRVVLPSTSPAHAAMPYSQKLALWRQGLSPEA